MNWWKNQVFIEDFIQQSDEIEGEYDLDTHIQHLRAWEAICDDRIFNENLILTAHKVLMQELRPDIAGIFRQCDVTVGGRRCPRWQDVPNLLKDFITIFNEAFYRKTQIWALEEHVNFEKIHPFEDGNGRTGRLLYLWHCKQINIHPMIFRVKDVQGYYSLFKED